MGLLMFQNFIVQQLTHLILMNYNVWMHKLGLVHIEVW